MASELTGRQRLLTAIDHREADRVPISPRLYAWLWGNCGNIEPETLFKWFPDVDLMHVYESETPNILESFVGPYNLPEVHVEQQLWSEGDCEIVERTFQTPAGVLHDRTRIPPPGREYGPMPNPQQLECLVKTPGDLQALRFLLPPIRVDADRLQQEMTRIGERGLT
ncbi:hypothetical protein JW992_06190, partial [candidate division KSB1 bacterium]|nr:hypothetical protein [candidate division KSB1 bacterium]